MRRSLESSLHPNSHDRGSSPNIHTMISPSDMVGPSPVTSNGTDATEIEDEASDEAQEQVSPPSMPGSAGSIADSTATVGNTTSIRTTHC